MKRSVALVGGQRLLVDLATCGGCGYSWNAKQTGHALSAVSPSTSIRSGTLPGSPETTRYSFTAAASAGSGELDLTLVSPAGETDRTVTLTVAVS